MLYRRIVRPLLFSLPPEAVHHASLAAIAHTPLAALMEPFARRDFPALERKLFGLTFPNRSAWRPASTRMRRASRSGRGSASASWSSAP
ncbi:MAG: hypothetical protein WDO13_02220 [Verrucomicrobiota bacterium]